MIIKNEIRTTASLGKVWKFISDPAVMKSWNPRIRAVVPVTLGNPKANSQYRIRYILGRREDNFVVEIMEYEEHHRLVLHFAGGTLPRKGFIQEIFELVPDSGGTLVIQTIVMEETGLRLPARLWLRLRNRIGRSSGKRYLSRLRELAEEEA
jgi:uncharacterized protein YndB with AHSA1/START domain